MSRDIKRAMGDYLPKYYADSPEMQNIIDVESSEMTTLNAAIVDVLNQYFVDKATWGLAYWERVCGIPTDESKPYTQRRSVIKSKLRGVGTVTVALIKNVAEAYLNGEVEVAEDSANYTINVTFVGKLGVPANLNDIKNALREIIPAHLAIGYEFVYLTFGDLAASGKTFADIEAAGLTFGELSTWDLA